MEEWVERPTESRRGGVDSMFGAGHQCLASRRELVLQGWFAGLIGSAVLSFLCCNVKNNKECVQTRLLSRCID